MLNNLVQTRTIAVTTSCILLFGGCAAVLEQNAGRIGGTAIGAGAGAVIGKQLGGDTGLIIGAIVGGGVGYFIGNEIDTRRENLAKIAKEENIEVVSQNVITNNDSLSTKSSNEKVDNKNIIGDSFTIISNEQQFQKNSNKLEPKSEEIFSKIAKEYKDSDKKILIIGHTDDSGNSEYNQKLSEERARNVGNVFNTVGVKKSNIYYLGAGENNPIANNNTVNGAEKNRRVEVVELRDENDIVNYASKTSNPKFFKNIEPVVLAKSNNTKVQKKPKTTEKKVDITKDETTEKEINNTPTTISKNIEEEKIVKKSIKNSDIFDFKGSKLSGNEFALKSNFGESTQEAGFSFFTKAQASVDTKAYQNCLADKPRVKADPKSLDTNKVVYKTIEYKKGLTSVPFVAKVENTLLTINPVAVLESGSSSSVPKVSFYKDYKGEKDIKPTLELDTYVNTYQGTQGLIYRLFFNNPNTQMQCMDIVFDEKNVNSSKGVLYYTKNSQIFEKEFSIARIK